MSIFEKLKKGIMPGEIRFVAREEKIDLEVLKENVKKGFTVILANKNHKSLKIPTGVGKDLCVKVNANIGASPVFFSIKKELKKLKVAVEAGADTVMDLTILNKSEDIDKVRREMLANCSVPLGTVPIYQVAVEAGCPHNMDVKTYLKVFERQVKEGVDFTTVHAGVTRKALKLVKKRLIPVVSRGGSFLLSWMKKNNKENFLYEYFDEILDIAYEYNVTLSLGDGLRPGCIFDATDKAQIYELKVLGELAEKARAKNVQVMIEGPGHIPLNQIEKNVKLEKKICRGAPFYVLGPLPLDRAAGYDHIVSGIGGALAAFFGADFLCYVTPREHIGLPSEEDVREGVVVTKISALIADLAKGNRQEFLKNKLISEARKNFDWGRMRNLVIDKEKFDKYLKSSPHIKEKKGCSMCGDEFCALKVFSQKRRR
ncbi:MAG: phosphomethylpyrimidine synthase [Candidatus Omnitrophota bacterium]|nr:MAG: phosphomethylpyrimidine synthase [Candidatus Omnitrophota bacterium]